LNFSFFNSPLLKSTERPYIQHRSPKKHAEKLLWKLSVEALWLPLTPEHGFPSLYTWHRALPLCQPLFKWKKPPLQNSIKKGYTPTWYIPVKKQKQKLSTVALSTSDLGSKKFLSACKTSSPVLLKHKKMSHHPMPQKTVLL